MQPQAQQKRPRRALPIVLTSAAGVLVLLIVIGIVGAVAGGDNKPATQGDAAATSAPGPHVFTPVPDAPGIPVPPDPEQQAAYLSALKGIDPEIVGDTDAALIVDRGLSQCQAVADGHDQAKLVDLTNERFTSSGHPDGFGTAKAERILATVRDHLCPTY